MDIHMAKEKRINANNSSLPLAEDREKAIFSVESLSFSYDEKQKILDDINFALFPGENIGLCGVNGSGKTTFFRCVTGLIKPNAGIIKLGGIPVQNEKDFVNLRRKIGFALQNADDQIFFPTVLEDVAFGPLNQGLSLKEATARAEESLAVAGLENYEKKLSYNLSGGEKRLVALAGIIAMRPDALLLDEPLTGLDEKARERVTQVIKNLKCAKVIVAHDRNFLEETCQKKILLKSGRFLSAPQADRL